MGISLYKIKKWTNMLLGKSVYHVNQGKGTIFSKDGISGYYNDLTEKVTKFGLEDASVPQTTVDTGESIYFSIAIFQYGLGAYDLYLKDRNSTYLDKVVSCAEWALQNQQADGSWVTFEYKKNGHPYSSMAQAEGISLLIRAHIATNRQEYLDAASRAITFMLKPVSEGGTSLYVDDDVLLLESTADPVILNGWIFSIWGVYDYCKYTNDPSAEEILNKTLASLKNHLPNFDMKYWSKYDAGNRICSPFYHNLHIHQLEAMYDLFGDDEYRFWANKWKTYQQKPYNKARAFCSKALQKIKE